MSYIRGSMNGDIWVSMHGGKYHYGCSYISVWIQVNMSIDLGLYQYQVGCNYTTVSVWK